MFIHLLAFFVCASLGTELRSRACNENSDGKEIDVSSVGLTVSDVNEKPVELTTEQGTLRRQVVFKLYTKQRPTEPEELKINDVSSLRKSGFNASKPTYMITHGWIGSEKTFSCIVLRDAYLANTDSNVIVVDWSSYSWSIRYVDVTFEIKGIGQTIQRLIKWLYENGLKGDDLTLIGHSLGAHVMGVAGYELTPKVNNIVALDPVLAMYAFADDSEAISKKDAKHVQIIHTNAGGFGYISPYGHSDFYPNGGSRQPGCCDGFLGCAICSHFRAVYLFAESISSNNNFVGTACNSYADFKDGNCGENPQTATMGGLNLASVTPGVYYLRTGSKKPFATLT